MKKKLCLLQPDVKTVYLSEGVGEKVEYLKVPSGGASIIENDVLAGGDHLKELLSLIKKNKSRVTVIDASSREEGLLAVSYMAAALNEEKGLKENDVDDEDLGYSTTSENMDTNIDLDEFDFENPSDYYDGAYGRNWIEDAYKIPIVEVDDIDNYFSANVFFMGNYVARGDDSRVERKPFWLSCNNESICIINNGFNSVPHMFTEHMKKFAGNRHVYFVKHSSGINPFGDFNEFYGSSLNMSFEDEAIMEFVLENTADFVAVKIRSREYNEYRKQQFIGWMAEKQLKCAKKFPFKEIVKRILLMNSNDKSHMMERIISYMIKEKEKRPGDTVSGEDFDILKKFIAIGVVPPGAKRNDAKKKLERELVGMDSVKNQVKEIVNVLKYQRLREKKGLKRSNYHNVHMLIGAPGTAKTTVAKLMGDLMMEEHLLPGNRFISVNGADLKGMYVGHSAPKTHQLFIEHDIILIDEAYSLVADGSNSDSFSQEAVAQLIIELEEHAMDKLVMFAGYGGDKVNEIDNRMKVFLEANPGIRSRINSTIFFPSYSPDEMVEIVHCQAKVQGLEVDKGANPAIRSFFAKRSEDRDFGNGREARSLLETAMVFAAKRVMALPMSKITKKSMNAIRKEDILSAITRMTEAAENQRGQGSASIGFSVS